MNKAEEKYYERLAEQAERGEIDFSEGEVLRGSKAAAAGRAMLREALGSDEAVDRAIRGGRPNLGAEAAGAGASPTIRVRVTPSRKREIELLKQQLHQRSTSDVVRAALDEYVANHLRPSA